MYSKIPLHCKARKSTHTAGMAQNCRQPSRVGGTAKQTRPSSNPGWLPPQAAGQTALLILFRSDFPLPSVSKKFCGKMACRSGRNMAVALVGFLLLHGDRRCLSLYAISQELEQLFPGRHYTPDGHRVGSIGEALAAGCYRLELFTAGAETPDAKAPDGRLVQIKVTQMKRVSLSSKPKWLLVLKIHPDGTFTGEYNGPGALVWDRCGKMQKNGQRPISRAALRKLREKVPVDNRLPQSI